LPAASVTSRAAGDFVGGTSSGVRLLVSEVAHLLAVYASGSRRILFVDLSLAGQLDRIFGRV
jgi:hypothetical protein